MTLPNSIVFLVDVDNTLLDNDRIQSDIKRHLDRDFGVACRERYWTILEQLFMIGAVGFSWANSVLSSVGAEDRKRCGVCVSQPSEASNPGSGNAIALGTAMDAIPEALVLGLTLKTHGPEAALIAAIALGNLPGDGACLITIGRPWAITF
jgi:hypothetical protein